jgi:hypothetical protein
MPWWHVLHCMADVPVSLVQRVITGLFLYMCRHGITSRALHMTTGERHVYAMLVLLSLLRLGVAPLFFMYDIVCRFWPSLLSRVQRESAAVQALAAKIVPLLPPVHVYAHMCACVHAITDRWVCITDKGLTPTRACKSGCRASTSLVICLQPALVRALVSQQR